jgi:purine nucleoside phosphorylase
MLAILGGKALTNFYQSADFNLVRKEVMRTPYGEPSGIFTIGEINGNAVVFLPRHGFRQALMPHHINYRANMWALAQLKPKAVLSVASVMGLDVEHDLGELIVPDQIIDYTTQRETTYHEDGIAFRQQPQPETLDFLEPFNKGLRQKLIATVQEKIAFGDGAKLSFHLQGTYAAVDGPRSATGAEAKRFVNDGANMIGMTGMPEAVLAMELGLPYAMLAVVTSLAFDKKDNTRESPVSHIEKVVAALSSAVSQSK